jgi:hypothetical protein
LIPYDLQEEAAREEILKQISNPSIKPQPASKQGTPAGLGSAGGFNFYSSTFDEIVSLVLIKPLEVLERKTLRGMNLYIQRGEDEMVVQRNLLQVMLNDVLILEPQGDLCLKKATKKLKQIMTQCGLPHLNNQSGNTPVMTPVKGNKGQVAFSISNHFMCLPQVQNQETQTILDDQKFLEKYGYGKGFS